MVVMVVRNPLNNWKVTNFLFDIAIRDVLRICTFFKFQIEADFDSISETEFDLILEM